MQVTNTLDKTASQIGEIVSGVTVPNKAYWDSHVYQRMVEYTTAFLQRGYSARDFATLAAAINRAESDTAMIVVSTNEAISVTDTLHRTAALWVYKGGTINVAAARTFLIQGNFFAGNYKIFEGSGTVKFAEGSVDFVNPAWFGAVGDSSTASLSGIQKALNSGVSTGKIRVKLAPGTYLINDSLQIQSNTEFIGENATIVSSDTNSSIIRGGVGSKNIKISGLTTRYFHVNRVRQPNTSAFRLAEIDTLEVSNCHIIGAPGMGIMLVACKAIQVHNNIVERTLADGIHITNGLNTDTGRDIWSEDFQITNNKVFDTGDDHIAVVSYQRPVPDADTLTAGQGWTGSQLQIRRGVIANNIVHGTLSKYRSRGISILGARDVVIANNVVQGDSAVGDSSQTLTIAGILVQGGTYPFRFNRASRIKVIGNTIYNSKADHSGAAFELISGAIRIYGADSVDVIGNTIDWTPFMSGVMVYGDTILSQYGWDSTPRDVRILDNTINNARLGVHLLQIQYPDTSTRWIQRVTIRGNRFSNLRRDGVVVTRAKTVLIEDNEFFGLNKSDASSIQGINLNVFAGNTVVRNNKFFSTASTDSVTNLVSVGTPVSSGTHTAHLYLSEDNIYDHPVRNSNVVISSGIITTGLFEYGSIDYLADTLSTTTTYRQFAVYQNRPRSTVTVSYAADSLTITNAGTYRVSGHMIAASEDSNDTITIGISVNNATPTDNALTVAGYLGDSSQFFTIPFNFFITLTANDSIKPKFKIASGTSNIYIRRAWLTVERLN